MHTQHTQQHTSINELGCSAMTNELNRKEYLARGFDAHFVCCTNCEVNPSVPRTYCTAEPLNEASSMHGVHCQKCKDSVLRH
ncbi:Fatty acid hydroxylase vlmA [Fusarium oxysporum f. sp. albedinis]|nr:Fatty acid hydroxylase vlmA [Fusarium oxysporum f. sp. albedinis]